MFLGSIGQRQMSRIIGLGLDKLWWVSWDEDCQICQICGYHDWAWGSFASLDCATKKSFKVLGKSTRAPKAQSSDWLTSKHLCLVSAWVHWVHIRTRWGMSQGRIPRATVDNCWSLQCYTYWLLRAGPVCGLGSDVCEMHIISLAARFRTAASSGTLVNGLSKIRAAREYETASIYAHTPEWEERFLKMSMPFSTMEAYEYVRQIDRTGKIADSLNCIHHTQPTHSSHSRTRFFRVAQDLSHRVRIHRVSQNSHSSHLAWHVARAFVVVSFTLEHYFIFYLHFIQSDLLDHPPDLYRCHLHTRIYPAPIHRMRDSVLWLECTRLQVMSPRISLKRAWSNQCSSTDRAWRRLVIQLRALPLPIWNRIWVIKYGICWITAVLTGERGKCRPTSLSLFQRKLSDIFISLPRKCRETCRSVPKQKKVDARSTLRQRRRFLRTSTSSRKMWNFLQGLWSERSCEISSWRTKRSSTCRSKIRNLEARM